MSLPTGAITFLFTDIEGSTRLWEEHPVAMRVALARHDAILRTAIDGSGGVVFKTVGDAFCAAFAVAADALAAAVLAQRLLLQEGASGLSLRVRMALHTGAAEARDGDYFGQPLNRVARLLAIGHGGQVLLSQSARDMLPADASLVDMGHHRLKDLQQPEHVFQALAPDLPDNFPPLRSLHRTNLPYQSSSFVGRKQEIEEVKRLLGASRLLTLTGSGGCGKTRLAVQVAAEVLDRYPDGVWLAELASLSGPDHVPQTLATVLGLREEPRRTLIETLIAFLQPKHVLLVLDNCEHLVDACASLANSILGSCPDAAILATSREPLIVPGERPWRVPPLSTPAPADLPTVEKEAGAMLMEYDAPRLFVERAAVQRQGFSLTRNDAYVVAHLCQRLDGIPLAIELAAARVRAQTVQEINERLDDRFRLLTMGSRTALRRHQTLRALIDWSYDLLSHQEKVLLCRLSVFAGGWTMDAAEQVTSSDGVDAADVLDLLTSLADKSLIVVETQESNTRYRLLETVRQYTRDRLAERDEQATMQVRHQAFFASVAEAADPHLRGPDQAAWLHRLEREHDNLRTALDAQDQTAALRIAGALAWFWYVRGYFSEGRERLAATLARAGIRASSPARAKALQGAGVLAYAQGDYAEARGLYEQSLALQRELGDRQRVADSLNSLGVLLYEQGDFAGARTLLEESLALRRELGDSQSVAASLNNLGLVAHAQDDYEAARTLQEESLRIFRGIGDKGAMAYSLLNLGNVAFAQGDNARARPLFEESLALRRELGDKAGVAYSLMGLGCVAQAQGDNATARIIHAESLALLRELSDKRGIAFSLHNLGISAHTQGDCEAARRHLSESLCLLRDITQKHGIAASLKALASLDAVERKTVQAVRLWGAAEALREEIGAPLPPNDREEYERDVGAARELLGEEAFQAAWAAGRLLTLEQAINAAVGACTEHA